MSSWADASSPRFQVLRNQTVGCDSERRIDPCRCLADRRAMVTEDRSAEGIRVPYRTGPGTQWVHAEPAGGGAQRAPAVVKGHEEPQVSRQSTPDLVAHGEAGQSWSLPPSPIGLGLAAVRKDGRLADPATPTRSGGHPPVPDA